jgi:hypothetical protein
VAFEVLRNSEGTFYPYDWDHIDAQTGHSWALQDEHALACIDFAEGCGWSDGARGGGDFAVARDRLFRYEHLWL